MRKYENTYWELHYIKKWWNDIFWKIEIRLGSEVEGETKQILEVYDFWRWDDS